MSADIQSAVKATAARLSKLLERHKSGKKLSPEDLELIGISPASDPAMGVDEIRKADRANMARKVRAGKTLSVSERAILAAEAGGLDPNVTGFAETDSELARQVSSPAAQFNRQRVQTWKKDPSFPARDQAGRHNVAAVIEWLKQRGKIAGQQGTDIEREKLRNLIIKNDDLQTIHDKRRGALIPREEVNRDLTRCTIEAKTKILNGLKTAIVTSAAKLALTPEQFGPIEAAVEQNILDAMLELSRTVYGPVACPHCGKKI